ncbi:putative Peptidyl-prolyl cis-trans isomerase [Pseudoalteromonas luteoviolacea B = ATCC 29581]|nr:putative Peptidyl-prolyl cis-trans isomerase [Pseudoalteromonas luteoviolacea B = ATCC 29581]
MKNVIRNTILGTALCALPVAHATVVEFQTSQGTFEVNLFDNTTPKTVENFLKYVNAERYSNSQIHRVVTGFVVQGGGIKFDANDDQVAIETFPAVVNEPKLSNVKGTIAMAKTPGDANSATSQWFFNLTDNSANLDLQNGGFTVFGQVTGNGMQVIETIASQSRCGEVPVVNVSTTQCADPTFDFGSEHAVMVYSVSVLDDDPNSANSLSPKANTLINQTNEIGGESSSGGSIGFIAGILLAFSAVRRKR